MIEIEKSLELDRIRFGQSIVVLSQRVVLCEVDFLAEVNLTHHDGQFWDLDRFGKSGEDLECKLVELVNLDLWVLEASSGP